MLINNIFSECTIWCAFVGTSCQCFEHRSESWCGNRFFGYWFDYYHYHYYSLLSLLLICSLLLLAGKLRSPHV